MPDPYTPNWSNANVAGLVDSTLYHRRADLAELADAINRRRLLVIQTPFDYPPVLNARPYVSQYAIDDGLDSPNQPPYEYALAMRNGLVGPGSSILNALPGMDGYLPGPANPISLNWLWPEADGDENKIIRSWQSSPSPTEVGLFNRLNGTTTWTDPTLMPGQFGKAVHVNELRRVVAMLRRGRWTLPIYWRAGMLSDLPDLTWIPDTLGNDGVDELRSVGGVRFHVDRVSGRHGLHGVRALSASLTFTLSFTGSATCEVELRHVLRPVTFLDNDGPSWTYYRRASKLPWAQPGGAGVGDSVAIGGAITVSAGVPVVVNDASLLPAVQAMLDETAPSFFMLRQLDVGKSMVAISNATITVDFELASPPA